MLIARRTLEWLLIPLGIAALAYEPNFSHGFINYNESGQHLAAIAELHRGAFQQLVADKGSNWRFSRRFPDHRIAANKCQSSIPSPNSDRKIKG